MINASSDVLPSILIVPAKHLFPSLASIVPFYSSPSPFITFPVHPRGFFFTFPFSHLPFHAPSLPSLHALQRVFFICCLAFLACAATTASQAIKQREFSTRRVARMDGRNFNTSSVFGKQVEITLVFLISTSSAPFD